MNKEQELFFKNYLKDLHGEAQRLTSYIEIYRHLHEKTSDRLDEINLAPAFFGTVLDSLFTGIVLWTHNLFDEKSDKGFVNFLNFIKRHINILEIQKLKERKNYSDDHWVLEDRNPITLKTIKSHIDKINKLFVFKSIKIRRDKFHAHFDAGYFHDRAKISTDAPLIWNNLDDIIDLMDDIINTYSTAFDGEIYTLGIMNIFDIDIVLDILKEDNDRKQDIKE